MLNCRRFKFLLTYLSPIPGLSVYMCIDDRGNAGVHLTSMFNCLLVVDIVNAFDCFRFLPLTESNEFIAMLLWCYMMGEGGHQVYIPH